MTIYVYLAISLLPIIIFSFFGFYIDMDVYGQIDTISLCLGYASLVFLFDRFIRTVATIFIFSSVVFFILFAAIGLEYFKFYDVYISYDSLSLFQELLLALNNFSTLLVLILISVSLLIVVFLHYFILNKLKRLTIGHSALAMFCCLSLMFALMSLHHDRKHIETALEIDGFIAKNYDEENPLMYFIRSVPFLNFNDETSETERSKSYLKLVANALARDALFELPSEFQPSNYEAMILDYPGFSSIQDPVNPLKFVPINGTSFGAESGLKNVIYIVLESFRSFEIDKMPQLAPNLAEIAKKSYRFSNNYATSRATVKSEQAMLCSSIDGNLRGTYSRSNGNYGGNCLPKILKNFGYETIWYHGNTKDFYNREKFHPTLGFNILYDKEVFETQGYSPSEDIGWGIPDSIVYREALNDLAASNKPFFAEILTVSSHQPFNWDYRDFRFPEWLKESDDIYHNYLRSIYYADAALGEFWEAFQQSALKDNTILVITGDHGVPYYPGSMISENEQFNVLFKVPLVIFDGSSHTTNIESVVSHLDIAPTVLSLLDIHVESSFLGRPLLGSNATYSRRPIFHMNIDGYGFRYGNTVCIPQNNICDDNQELCYKTPNFECKLEDVSHREVVQQSGGFMRYIELLTAAGFVDRRIID